MKPMAVTKTETKQDYFEARQRLMSVVDSAAVAAEGLLKELDKLNEIGVITLPNGVATVQFLRTVDAELDVNARYDRMRKALREVKSR